ncbi:Hypothetical protein NGAL_HAMBI490_40530 [Neorhizobium galegae bv. officinalis]|nr:Hypothetical protein NGAL_HAMBI490_40530 [Neorhizobium galegae bv. officinalis]
MNAEIAARLEWSFDKGYDASAEVEAVKANALKKIQASPIIQLEKQMIAVEARVERQIEELQQRVDELEAKVATLLKKA